jgi:molybdopterin/thiamine biosynthesis adenylyltransferase
LTTFFSKSKRPRNYRCKELKPNHPAEIGVTGRQEAIVGFDQQKLRSLKVILIGGGGICGEIGEGLVRKGVGKIVIFDNDIVEMSNLNRQFFFENDLYKPKAFQLAKNLSKNGFMGTEIAGYSMSFQDAVESKIDLNCDVALCGVDNDGTRSFVSKFYHQLGIPVIFMGTSKDANQGYVFVQELDRACFGCAFPNALHSDEEAVRCTPASKDTLKVIAGFALMAVDSLVMPRKIRRWNFRHFFLNGVLDDRMLSVQPRANCPICNSAKTEEK